jgi:hypothetical protein
LLGAIAQLGERYNGIVEVKGSSPFSSTTTLPSAEGFFVAPRQWRVMMVWVIMATERYLAPCGNKHVAIYHSDFVETQKCYFQS